MPTIADLKLEANQLLKKAGKATADDTDLMRWFNECRRRLQRKAKIKTVWTLALTGTETYTLNASAYPIYRLHDVYLIAPGGIMGEQLDILPGHVRWEKGVRFTPAPSSTGLHMLNVWPKELAGSLELHGEVRMSEFTADTQTPQIPEEFHTLFPLYAAHRFGGQDEDFAGDGRFQNYGQEYAMLEQEFLQSVNQGSTRYRSVRLTRGWE